MKRTVIDMWRFLCLAGLIGCHSVDGVGSFASVGSTFAHDLTMVDIPFSRMVLLVSLVVAIGLFYLILQNLRSRRPANEQQSVASLAPLESELSEMAGTAAFEELRNFVSAARQRHNLSSDREAFTYLFLTEILHLNDQASRTAITSGNGNGGIDAIHIDRKGAQVPGCEYGAAHIIACDYVEDVSQCRHPIPRERAELVANTWVAIASSTDRDLQLNAPLRRQIKALHSYWRNITNDLPHQIYVVTNRVRSVVDRDWIEKRMNYFASHDYHYYEQADLVGAYCILGKTPTNAARSDSNG